MGALATLAIAATLLGDPAPPAGAPAGTAAVAADTAPRHISVRIHDYASLPPRELLETQSQVADIYAAIGVVIDWRVSVHPGRVAAGLDEWPLDSPAALSVLIVTEEMSHGTRIREEVAGYAAVSPAEGGSVAFVVADRTQHIAECAHVGHARVAASVIAHELAHLLMPNRPHSRDGLMKANWRPTDFRFAVSRTFSFAEADLIRRAASRVSLAIARADN